MALASMALASMALAMLPDLGERLIVRVGLRKPNQ